MEAQHLFIVCFFGNRSDNWIEQATGNKFPVYPVLAIPGWYINRTSSNGIRLYNGKSSQFLAKGKNVLSDQEIKSICCQVERMCRDIDPKSYPIKKPSNS
jgi:hypothetical protein